MKSRNFSPKTRPESFKHASRGLWAFIKNEHNAWIHLLAAIIAIAFGIILRISVPEWCLLGIVIGTVFIAELLNSSLEALGDIVDPEWNEKVKKAKDYSAASVLVSAIVSLIIGGLIFIPKILDLL